MPFTRSTRSSREVTPFHAGFRFNGYGVAISALKALQSVAAGVTNRSEYQRRMLDTKIVVDRELEKAKDRSNPVWESIRKAMVAYEDVSNLWSGVRGQGILIVSESAWRNLEERYARLRTGVSPHRSGGLVAAAQEDVYGALWRSASDELEEAETLIRAKK